MTLHLTSVKMVAKWKKSKKIKVSALIFNSYPPNFILSHIEIFANCCWPPPTPKSPSKKVCYYIDYLSKNTTFPPNYHLCLSSMIQSMKKASNFFSDKGEKVEKTKSRPCLCCNCSLWASMVCFVSCEFNKHSCPHLSFFIQSSFKHLFTINLRM